MYQLFSDPQAFPPQEVLMRALLENYESIYVIDEETSAYKCFHESDSFKSLQLESSGENFFQAVLTDIVRTIYPPDQDFVRRMLSRRALLEGLARERHYGFVYRLVMDGLPLYHKLRATSDEINGRSVILVGVRNVDVSLRRDITHAEAISALHKKEKTHLEAILASAAGYLEANLTKDRLLELSPYVFTPDSKDTPKKVPFEELLSYTDFENRREAQFVVENQEEYRRISSREYLIQCFDHGERRASVSFAFQLAGWPVIPCKNVFYLYQDDATGDVLTFTVTYDLTEHQRHEMERKSLEAELQMSRIRNSTSQMQPHFLYNVLGSLQEVVLEDPEYASEILGDFTTHLRSCIRAMSSDNPIPFEQELSNIKAYLNIEKMRFGSKLNVIYEIKTSDFSVLPLSIQPIVENAVRHGIYQRGPVGGTVRIRTDALPDCWRITVSDTGVGFDAEAFLQGSSANHADSTGLKNLIFRLEHVMNGKVSIHSVIGVGTTISISIPMEV